MPQANRTWLSVFLMMIGVMLGAGLGSALGNVAIGIPAGLAAGAFTSDASLEDALDSSGAGLRLWILFFAIDVLLVAGFLAFLWTTRSCKNWSVFVLTFSSDTGS